MCVYIYIYIYRDLGARAVSGAATAGNKYDNSSSYIIKPFDMFLCSLSFLKIYFQSF